VVDDDEDDEEAPPPVIAPRPDHTKSVSSYKLYSASNGTNVVHLIFFILFDCGVIVSPNYLTPNQLKFKI